MYEKITRLLIALFGTFLGALLLALTAIPSTNPNLEAATKGYIGLWVSASLITIALVFLIISDPQAK